MNHADPFVAGLLLVMMGIVLYGLWRARQGKQPYIRPIPGIGAMEEAVKRAAEMGRPVFFVTGNNGIQDIASHASMAMLDHVGRLAARQRIQLTAMIHVADVYPLAEATLRNAYEREGAGDLFQPRDQVRFLSDNSVVFAAAVSRMVEEELPGCVIFFGGFDFSALLLSEPGARLGVFQVAGDPALFQIPFFTCTCNHTIIGEEYYAAGAYVSSDLKMRNSLLSQDLVKLVFVIILLAAIVMMCVLPEKKDGSKPSLIEYFNQYKKSAQ